MPQPRPLFIFSFYSNTDFTEKAVGFSGIRTQIPENKRMCLFFQSKTLDPTESIIILISYARAKY